MYKADEIQFPKWPGNRAARPATEADMDKYEEGYTNPDLFRIIDPKPIEFTGDGSAPFNPYNQTPQFELMSRSYKLYISGGNSYRMTQIFNHDEESTFWEIP